MLSNCNSHKQINQIKSTKSTKQTKSNQTKSTKSNQPNQTAVQTNTKMRCVRWTYMSQTTTVNYIDHHISFHHHNNNGNNFNRIVKICRPLTTTVSHHQYQHQYQHQHQYQQLQHQQCSLPVRSMRSKRL